MIREVTAASIKRGFIPGRRVTGVCVGQVSASMRRITSSLHLMASLKNVRHEKFAQCVASGSSGADAYRQAAEYSGKQADGNAANWMKRPGVRQRIEELKAESAARCSLSREAHIRSLVEMYEAKPGDASMDNPRCDVLITRGQKHAVFPQKLAVGAQLSKLVGWDRPTQVRHIMEHLTQVV